MTKQPQCTLHRRQAALMNVALLGSSHALHRMDHNESPSANSAVFEAACRAENAVADRTHLLSELLPLAILRCFKQGLARQGLHLPRQTVARW